MEPREENVEESQIHRWKWSRRPSVASLAESNDLNEPLEPQISLYVSIDGKDPFLCMFDRSSNADSILKTLHSFGFLSDLSENFKIYAKSKNPPETVERTLTSSPSSTSLSSLYKGKNRLATVLKSRSFYNSPNNNSSSSFSTIKMKPGKPIASYPLENGDDLILRKSVKEEKENGNNSSFLNSSSSFLGLSNPKKLDFSKRNIEFESNGEMVGYLKRGEKEKSGTIELEKELDKISQLLFVQNRIRSIPDDFFAPFTNLRSLDLSHNHMKEFPKGLWTLNKLEKLKFSDNELSILPKEISQLVNLQKISLVRNKINEIAEEIADLKDLRVVLFDDNKIKKLPSKLGTCHIKTLSVSNNPMISPPGFICLKGTDAILKYLSGVENALHTQSNSVQVFEFNWKVPFSTGVQDLDDIKSSDGKQRRQRGKNIRNEHRFTARDSVFASQNYLIQFFLESGANVSKEGSNLPPSVHPRFPLIEAFLSSFSENEIKMEDTSQLALYSVFEPSGGKRTAEFCRDSLHLKMLEVAANPTTHFSNSKLNLQKEELMNSPDFANMRHTSAENVDFPNILKQSFVQLDADFMQIANFEQLSSGAGACSALIVDNQLVLASLGGCGAMLIRGQTPYRLTEPFTQPKEETSHAPWSHGFGFREQKERGTVANDPKIKCEVITPRDQYLILGTSGLFEHLSDRRICETVNRSNSANEAAEKLISTAVSRGSSRGISVLVLKLCWFVQSVRRNLSIPTPVKMMPPTSRFASAPSVRPFPSLEQQEEERAMAEFIDMSVSDNAPSSPLSPSKPNDSPSRLEPPNYTSFSPVNDNSDSPRRQTMLGAARSPSHS